MVNSLMKHTSDSWTCPSIFFAHWQKLTPEKSCFSSLRFLNSTRNQIMRRELGCRLGTYNGTILYALYWWIPYCDRSCLHTFPVIVKRSFLPTLISLLLHSELILLLTIFLTKGIHILGTKMPLVYAANSRYGRTPYRHLNAFHANCAYLPKQMPLLLLQTGLDARLTFSMPDGSMFHIGKT